MSELRIGCIGAAIMTLLFEIGDMFFGHSGKAIPYTLAHIVWSISGFTLAVALFGRSKAPAGGEEGRDGS